MSTHPYRYRTCCVHSTAEAIIDMVDRSRDITWATFRRHVHWAEVQLVLPSYSYRRENHNPHTGELTCPFHIKDDWCAISRLRIGKKLSGLLLLFVHFR